MRVRKAVRWRCCSARLLPVRFAVTQPAFIDRVSDRWLWTWASGHGCADWRRHVRGVATGARIHGIGGTRLATRLFAADPDDPGRVSLMPEYWSSPGERVFGCASTAGNGFVAVTRHAASEQDAPTGKPSPTLESGPWRQEWRQLRFLASEHDPTEIVQSIVKVWAPAFGGLPVVRREVLTLGYTKTCSAIALSAAHACGANICKEQSLRALVVGMGAGTMPLWLSHSFPNLMCDVVELDPSVVKAATEALGFPKVAVRATTTAAEAARDATDPANTASLRVYVCDGQSFVSALVAEKAPSFSYDLVIIDAFDQAGAVPKELVDKSGAFLKGLRHLLSSRAGVALNVLCSSGTTKEKAEMADSIAAATGGVAFLVRTPDGESSNMCFGFSTAPVTAQRTDSVTLMAELQKSGRIVGADIGANFDLSRRLGVEFLQL